MARKALRVYADTSVFGGVWDEEFSKPSRAFFDQVRDGRFDLVLSPLIQQELIPAPEQIRRFLEDLLPDSEVATETANATQLQRAYLEAGIVSEKSADDALHVAIATISRCSMIVSWNFRHIVHFDKVPMYNAVNVRNGYPQIAIHSPSEVIEYEDQDI